jgi:hypothetical protein
MPYARHQSFHLRDGWIRKGLLAVRDDPAVFLAPDAPARLGLGVNMAEALRFWLVATGVATESRRAGQRVQQPTALGELVLRHDPYLEAEVTLWLLHAGLVRDPDGATTWHWFFNHYAPPLVEKEPFLAELDLWVRAREGKALSRATLAHDYDCLIHTYVPAARGTSPEDTIECPFAALELLAAADEPRAFRLQRPAVDRLDPLAVLYVMLRWQEASGRGGRQMGVADVLRQPANAGRTFNIGAGALSDILVRLEERHPTLAVRVDRSAGLDVLRLPDASADEVLATCLAQLGVAEAA